MSGLFWWWFIGAVANAISFYYYENWRYGLTVGDVLGLAVLSLLGPVLLFQWFQIIWESPLVKKILSIQIIKSQVPEEDRDFPHRRPF